MLKKTSGSNRTVQKPNDRVRTVQNLKKNAVDVERVFSSLSHVITKFRSKLNDNVIDDILFLKNYFKHLDKYKIEFDLNF